MSSEKANQKDKGVAYVLEQRLMLDAAAVATGAEVVAEAQGQQEAEQLLADARFAQVSTQEQNSVDELLAAVTETTESQGKSLVFIDGAVEDIDTLIAGVNGKAEVFVLDSNSDGLTQIAEIVASRENVGALHIVSHGGAGSLSLGEGQINFAALTQAQQQALGSIGGGLLAGADILIYGCDFGAGERGKNAVDTLAALTGADVAASDDQTGSSRLQADWVFEVQSGTINSALAFDATTQESFSVTLAESYYTNTDGNATWSAGSTSGDKWIKLTTATEDENTFIDTKDKVKFVMDGTNSFDVAFNIVDDNVGQAGNTSSEMIIGFTNYSEAQPGSSDYAAGTTNIDFGIYYDSGLAYAFINGDLTDLVQLGEDDADYKIEVDSDGTVNFYNGTTVVADSATDFSTTLSVANGDYVLDMDIFGAGDGFDNIVLTGEVLTLSRGSFGVNGTEGTVYDSIVTTQSKGLDHGDLNDDGYEDVVVAEADGHIAIFFNNADGTVTRGTGFEYTGSEHSAKFKDVAVADLNGDGDLDIVGVTYGGSNEEASIVFGINDGTGSFDWVDFEFEFTGTYIEKINSVAVGNFDDSGDSALDVAITDGQNGQVVVFSDVMSGANGSETVTVAGVTGSTTAVSSLSNISASSTNTSIISTGDDRPYVLETIEGAAADDQDYILVGTTPKGGSGAGRVFLATSSGQQGSDLVSDTGGFVLDLDVTQDNDGIGYVAAVSRSSGDTDNRVYVWEIDSFSAGVPQLTNYVSDSAGYIETGIETPRSVAFFEADGDDDMDLVVGSSTDGTSVMVYLNGTNFGADMFTVDDENDTDVQALLSVATGKAADLLSVNLHGTTQGTAQEEGRNEGSAGTTLLLSGGSENSTHTVRNVFDATLYYDRYSLDDDIAQNIVAVDRDAGDYVGRLILELSGIESGDVLEFGGDSIDLNTDGSGTFGVYRYTISSGQLIISLSNNTSLDSAGMMTLLDGLKFSTTSSTAGTRVFEFHSDSGYVAETHIIAS